MAWADTLKAKIAEEAARLRWQEEVVWTPVPDPKQAPLHRHNFIALSEEAFLHAAYRALLGRDPDPGGLAAYLPHCRNWLGRVAVLGHLAASPEGKALGSQIQGVRLWRWLYVILRRLPGRRGWLALADLWLRGLDLAAQLEAQRRQLEAQLEAQRRQLEAQLEAQRTALGHLKQSLGQTERRLAALLEAPEPATQVAEREALDRFYLAFEQACRGSEEAICAKLQGYLPWIQQSGGPVVDLGCGRGEWLGLLKAQGIAALGVETSPAMLEHCVRLGLEVVAGDALAWLSAQPEASLGAVTAFHLLEHLPFPQLLALVQAAYRALRAGGVAIFETPNPENVLVGSHTFYHDPTHRYPLTPTLLEFVLRYAGFEQVHLERLNPYPPEALVPGDGTLVERVNGHFYGPQDFAVIGIKSDKSGSERLHYQPAGTETGLAAKTVMQAG